MKTRILFFLTTLFFLHFGCKNNLDSMVDDFATSKNSSGKKVQFASVFESDFDAELMLESRYTLSFNATLSLIAPEASTYKWSLFRYEKVEMQIEGLVVPNDKYEEVNLNGRVATDQRKFFLRPAEQKDIISPGTYRLDLRVQNKSTLEDFEDSCTVVIYQPF